MCEQFLISGLCGACHLRCDEAHHISCPNSLRRPCRVDGEYCVDLPMRYNTQEACTSDSYCPIFQAAVLLAAGEAGSRSAMPHSLKESARRVERTIQIFS